MGLFVNKITEKRIAIAFLHHLASLVEELNQERKTMKAFTKFFCELGNLKYVPRSGWQLLGIRNPENVAEHSMRTAQIAYVLAKLEGHDEPEKIAVMALFHDMAETRVTDINKVAARYVDRYEADAVRDQTRKLGDVGQEIFSLWQEVEQKSSWASNIVKDADHLEVAFTALEYVEQGHSTAIGWFNRARETLHTDTAKAILEEMRTIEPSEWWHGLKVDE